MFCVDRQYPRVIGLAFSIYVIKSMSISMRFFFREFRATNLSTFVFFDVSTFHMLLLKYLNSKIFLSIKRVSLLTFDDLSARDHDKEDINVILTAQSVLVDTFLQTFLKYFHAADVNRHKKYELPH